jgi:hypothetical protein
MKNVGLVRRILGTLLLFIGLFFVSAPPSEAAVCANCFDMDCEFFSNSRLFLLNGVGVCAMTGPGCQECWDFDQGCFIVCTFSCCQLA